jgi:catechol 2,3-dioxygenase-like lactoylglutathione lyase family enzyme
MTNADAPKLNAFSVVFTVSSVGGALAFLIERLGFVEQFRMGDPPTYAIADRDAVSIQLLPAERSPETLGHARVYVFVSDVDALHAELKGRGCPIEMAPADQSYGMREMAVRDPDGNRIAFGQEIRS